VITLSKPLREIDLAWGAFAVANVAAMVLWESWETIPFHFIWVSLTLLYGFRVWPLLPTFAVLAAVCGVTGVLITHDIHNGTQSIGELSEVPLMTAMFLAMVWHGNRRQEAVRRAEALAESRAILLEQQERFLHDVSHELRTPMTIARGHLELLGWEHPGSPELGVAVDELARIERIISRLLLLAKAERPDFIRPREIDVEAFVEDVFVRWSDVTPRVWRLGRLARGSVWADEEALRTAMDALVENAVKHTEETESIELCASVIAGGLALDVVDGGRGVPPEARERIFDRFARADDARNRTVGGVGLGLAIVAAIATAHGGCCTVESQERGARFRLLLPDFTPERRSALALAVPSAASSS
jgi:signal transduction histidine kinase